MPRVYRVGYFTVSAAHSRQEKTHDTSISISITTAVELSKVQCPTKHIIGHTGDGFLRVKWPNQQRQSPEGRHKTKLNQIKQNTEIHLN